MAESIRFVLVRPANPENVGAAARALKNMGWRELWIVAPRFATLDGARPLARHARDVLDGVRVVATLDEALGSCRWIAGTTRRIGRRRVPPATPRDFAAAVRDAPERRPLAVVFGPEEDGLGRAEIARCTDLVRIPASRAQPSLNLAQAVLVLAYELRLGASAAPARHGTRAEATASEIEPMFAHLETMLLEVGFLRPDTAAARMLAVRRLLGRARPGPGDVRLVRGICRQVLWAARRGGRPV